MKLLTYGSLTSVKRFFKRNIDEIQASPLLRSYGFFLSLIHFFTFCYWFFLGEIYNQISKTAPAICQPFLQFCEAFRFGTPEVWRWILVAYFAIGVVGSILWLKKSVQAGYYLSIAMLLFKVFVYAQDYRLMGNYHYIHFIFISLFLFLPNKVKTVPFTVVLVYLGAGILKLNNEWISGSALYGDIGPLKWIPIKLATVYVIILELGFSFLLLSKNRKWQRFALFQFFLFHFYSIQIVGLFYPAVMYCILSIFLLMPKHGILAPSFSEMWNLKFYRVLAIVFAAAQVYPFLLPGNSALTGEGRLLSLNMFDAKAVCRHSFVVYTGLGQYQRAQLDASSVGVRIRCEPYYYLEYARRVCENFERTGQYARVDLLLQSRLSSENVYQPIVDQKDVCKSHPKFNPVGVNSWITKEKSATDEFSPWHYQDAVLGPENHAFMYREDAQRTGVAYANELVHPMSRPFWRKPDWNDSRHSASKSSPVSDGKKIYVGSDRGAFAAFDYEGDEVWRWSLSAERGVHGSALISGEAVFWGDYEGVLYSANKNDGKPNWILPLGQTIGSSPLLHDGAIFISVETFAPPDGFVAKVDAKSGRLIWKSPMLGEQAHSSPALSEDGKLLFVGSNNGFLNAINTETGEFAWRYSTRLAIKGTPLVAENSVIVCSWDKNIYRLNATTGELIWNKPLDSSCQSSAAWSKKENAVYISTSGGGTYALDLTSGREKWLHQGSGNFISSPVLLVKKTPSIAEELVANCFESDLCLFNSGNGQVLRRIKLGDRLTSVPWFNGNEMIYTLDTTGGLVRWK